MKTLNATNFVDMIESGVNNLSNNHREIDALNVFPVPDGDTGTNMNLTFTTGFKDIKNRPSKHVGQLSKLFSKGLLMGARGNSGVILSQIFRGFSQAVADYEEIDALQFATAFDSGKKVAYKAVMRPVEGTILTVLRLSSEATLKYVQQADELSIEDTLNYLIDQAQIALEKTPDLLPVLKEVGVVDSGGAGLVAILKGFQSFFDGRPIKLLDQSHMQQTNVQAQFEHEEFGYCTEFIVRLNEKSLDYFNENSFRLELEALGDSLVVVRDEDIVKVHVHTLTPGDALNLGQRYGEFAKLKIENMAEQHDALAHSVEELDTATLKVEKPFKEYALISVCAGDGLAEYFKELRVDHVVAGGQTMNPSTEEFVEVINSLNAKNIIILPNNSNIILAANQAKAIIDDKNIVVLETKSIPEGIAACINFNPELSLEDNLNYMTKAIEHTVSGAVTYAIKDTSFNGVNIKAGDYMAILGKNIVTAVTDKTVALKALVKEMVNDSHELITLVCGTDIDDEDAEELSDFFEEEYDVEVELVMGEQPVYSYLVGVE